MFCRNIYIIVIMFTLGLASCNDQTEMILEKAKVTIDTKASLQKNVAHISGKVTVHNPNNQKLDIGFTYSSVVEKPNMSMASLKYIKRGVYKSFDFQDVKIPLKYESTYYIRGFATDGNIVIYTAVFKVVVGKNIAISLKSPKEDQSSVSVTPTFEWSYSKDTTFDIFLKEDGETTFQKIADNIAGSKSSSNQNIFSWTPSSALDKNKKYQWYVATNDVDKLKSNEGNFDTFVLTGKLQTFDQPVLGYQEDTAGNKYILLYTGLNENFEGKDYTESSILLVKKNKNNKTLAVKNINLQEIPGFWSIKNPYYEGKGGIKFLKDNKDNFYLILVDCISTSGINHYYDKTVLTSNEGAYYIITKLNTDLELLWHKSIPIGLYTHYRHIDENVSVACDMNHKGEIIAAVGGVKIGSKKGDTKILLGKTYTSMGDGDIFVLRLDTNGNVLFQNLFGTKGKDVVKSVTINNMGRTTLIVSLNTKNDPLIYRWYMNEHTDTRRNHQLGDLKPKEKTTTLYMRVNGRVGNYHEELRDVIDIKTDSAGNLYELGHLTNTLTIQNKTISGNGYYLAKFDNTLFGKRLLLNLKPIHTTDTYTLLRMKVLDNKPYLIGFISQMDGLGRSFRSSFPCFFAAQVDSSLNINWIESTVVNKIIKNYKGISDKYRGISVGHKGKIYLYGSNTPGVGATIDKKPLKNGFIYRH